MDNIENFGRSMAALKRTKSIWPQYKRVLQLNNPGYLTFGNKLVPEKNKANSNGVMFHQNQAYVKKKTFTNTPQNAEVLDCVSDYVNRFKEIHERKEVNSVSANEKMFEYMKQAGWDTVVFQNRTLLSPMDYSRVQRPDTFNEDHTLIRANQGHSIPVDVELEAVAPPEILYHGTGEKYVTAIDEQGLIPKSRLYVHLSEDEETARKVGQRHGKPVIYIVKSGDMYRDGFTFFLSVNGVWLTKEVPVEYLEKTY